MLSIGAFNALLKTLVMMFTFLMSGYQAAQGATTILSRCQPASSFPPDRCGMLP